MKNFFLLPFLCLIALLHAQTDIDTVDFESSSPLIALDSNQANNLWQIGKPAKTSFTSAFSGNNAIVTDTVNTYLSGNTSSFCLGFELYGGAPSISFKHRFETDTLGDGGYVEASSDGGQSWYLLTDTTDFNGIDRFFTTDYGPYGLITSNFYGFEDSLVGGKLGFSGSSGGWQTAEIWFPCFAIKKSFRLLLRFTFVSDSVGNTKDGWMIDEIVIDNQGECSSLAESGLAPARVFPNPASGETHLSLAAHQYITKGQLLVFSLSGKKLHAQDFQGNHTRFNADALPPGIYQLLITENTLPVAQARLVVR